MRYGFGFHRGGSAVFRTPHFCFCVSQALGVASQLVEYLGKFNRRTLDMFSARAFSMLSLVHEKMGTLSSIRGYVPLLLSVDACAA